MRTIIISCSSIALALMLVGCGGLEQDWPEQGGAPAASADCSPAEIAACEAEHARWPEFQEAEVMGISVQVPLCDEPRCSVVGKAPAANASVEVSVTGVEIDYARGDLNVGGNWIRCQIRYRSWCGKGENASDLDGFSDR